MHSNKLVLVSTCATEPDEREKQPKLKLKVLSLASFELLHVYTTFIQHAFHSTIYKHTVTHSWQGATV